MGSATLLIKLMIKVLVLEEKEEKKLIIPLDGFYLHGKCDLRLDNLPVQMAWIKI